MSGQTDAGTPFPVSECQGDREQLLRAYSIPLISYTGTYDGSADLMAASSALLYLLIEEHDRPVSGVVRDRICEHLRNLISGGNEPMFTAGPFWHYATVSLLIAVAKKTPSVWDALTEGEKERLDLVMSCFAVATAFVSADGNAYKTGASLTGNHAKSWNPNHRMAMTLPIIGATSYFGADRVNAILTGFDYDTYLAKFREYGFTRAIYCWTTEGIVLPDGTKANSAKELLMNGGDAYLSVEDRGSISNHFPLCQPLGTGVGVRHVFTYHGIPLTEPERILEDLYAFNYSGGKVISDTAGMPRGTDEAGNPLAYILDHSKSPYEGEDGMMKEFISNDGGGIRSTTSYCTHDFMLVVQSLAAVRALGMYRPDSDSDLFRKMWVGNTDFLYKNAIGYHGYSIGKGYDKSDRDYPDYLPWRAWWLANDGMKVPEGLRPLSSFLK